MSETKLAPWPWTVDMESVGQRWTDCVSIYDATGYGHVAHLTRGYEDGPSMANARLIAAAPELLEVLQLVSQDDRMQCSGQDDWLLCKLWAAIAKAEGR